MGYGDGAMSWEEIDCSHVVTLDLNPRSNGEPLEIFEQKGNIIKPIFSIY